MKFSDNNSNLLRVAFPQTFEVHQYEPTKIHFDTDYIFLENIYSTLVEFTNQGDITTGITESFKTEKNKISLEIKKGLLTIDGYEITADDVEFSLKRILTLNQNTHGELRKALCSTEVIRIDQPCKNIIKTGKYSLELILDFPNDFLLPMLASIDFAIIPKVSIDPNTLKISDYRNTSGPYYVDQDAGDGNIVLKANPHHYHFRSDIPFTIEIHGFDRKLDRTRSLTLFEENKVDLITTVDSSRSEQLIPFYQRHKSNSNFHKTVPIGLVLFYFTPKGQLKFQRQDRFEIGAKIRNTLRNEFHSIPGYTESQQIFPTQSNGALSNDQMNRIGAMFPKWDEGMSPKEFGIWVSSGLLNDRLLKDLSNSFPKAKISQGRGIPAFLTDLNLDEEPDIVVVSTDVSFYIDISFLSYSFNAGIFGTSGEEMKNWLDKFSNSEATKDRIQSLNSLHFDLLSQGKVFPVVNKPYTALVRKGWKIELSQLFANCQFWKVRKD